METVVPPPPGNFRVPIPPPGSTTGVENITNPPEKSPTSPNLVKNTISSSTTPAATEPGGYDGKILRKSVMRKTVDYNSSIIKVLEARIWQRDHRDRRSLQPDVSYQPEIIPPGDMLDNPINAVTTKFVRTATNKMRCPIFCLAWTPEGRRLITGASSGEFTLWNGLTFNFETILQAHDGPIRTMVWSHDETWMVTGDHHGYTKYWQSNMNNVMMFQAHKEPVRGLSFSPTDRKFATCSDDGTVRIWDFMRCYEERILRGHGADVRCVDWHPQKGLIVSGSKDNQQPIKMWDPKTGGCIATLHAHKSTVMDMKWNSNGQWLLTASRDHLLKLFDIRKMSQEVQVFRGHKKEAASLAWHPVHEGLFCSGGSDGAVMFWCVGADKEVGVIEQAHDSIVWSLAWHPLGHILVTGSNDHTSKFWTRNRPGDKMRDKYNLNTLPAGVSSEEELLEQIIEEPKTRIQRVIPGMGPDDKLPIGIDDDATIPGLDFSVLDEQKLMKKTPYSKPIPKSFQKNWDEVKFKGSNEWSDKNQSSGDRRYNNQSGSSRFSRYPYRGRGGGQRNNTRPSNNLVPFPNLREPPPAIEKQDVDHRNQKDIDQRDSWNSGRDVDHRQIGNPNKDSDHRFGSGDQDMRQPPPQINMRNGPGDFGGGRDRNRGEDDWGGKRRRTENYSDQDLRFNADQDYRTKPQDSGRYQDSDSRPFRDNRKFHNNHRGYRDKDSRHNDRDSKSQWNDHKNGNWGQFNEAPVPREGGWRGRGRGSYNNNRRGEY